MPWAAAGAIGAAAIGAISNSGSSSNGATQTQQQQRGLPPEIASRFTNMLDTSQGVAGLPYTPYTGPRIAGFNGSQTGAMNRVIDDANNGETQAGGLYAGIGQNAGTSYGGIGQRAGTTYGGIGQNAGTSYGTIGQNAGTTYGGISNGAQRGFNQIANAGTPMVRGAQFTDYNVGNYINPETQNVINTTSDDLRHQLDITQNNARARAAAEGSYGGGRSDVQSSLNNADFGRTLASTVANLRSNAYNNAAGLIEQDAARSAGADQANQSSALTRLNQNLSATSGLTNAQLAAAQGQFGTQLGAAQGQFGTQLGAAQGQFGTQLGAAQGQFGTQLGAAQGVGSEHNSLTSGLMGIGTAQQGQTQKNLDVGYQDFLNQRNWPYTQLGLLQNAYSAFPANAFSNSNSSATEHGGGAGVAGLLQSGVGALGQSGAFGSNGWLTGAPSTADSFAGAQQAIVPAGSYFGFARGGLAEAHPLIDLRRGYDDGGEVWADPTYADAADTSGGDLGNDYGGLSADDAALSRAVSKRQRDLESGRARIGEFPNSDGAGNDWRSYQAEDFGPDLNASSYMLPGVTPVIGDDRVQVGAPSGTHYAGAPTGLAAISGPPPKAAKFSPDDPMWSAMIVGGGKATASRAPPMRALGEGLAAYGEQLESTRKNRQSERLSDAQINRLDAQTDIQRASFERQAGLMDWAARMLPQMPQATAATMPAGQSMTGAAPGTGTASPQAQAPTSAFRPSDEAWPAIAKQESGSQQFKDGQPQRSMPNDPDSPVGVGQIRPSTAADTAKKNGILFDPDKLATNAGYNERLSKLYYDELYGKYGNAPLALAAYNWGQGNLDTALKSSTGSDGQIDPQKLYGSMPSQTKEYLRSTLPQIQAQSGQTGGGSRLQMASAPAKSSDGAPVMTPTQAAAAEMMFNFGGVKVPSFITDAAKPNAVYMTKEGGWNVNPTVAEAEGQKAKSVSDAQLGNELKKIAITATEARKTQEQAAGLRTKTIRVNGRDIEVPESSAAKIGQQQLDATGLGDTQPAPETAPGAPAAAPKPIIGKGLFDEAMVEAYKKPVAETIEAAQNAPTSLQKLELLQHAAQGFRTGPTGPTRLELGKAWLDGLQSIGITPSKELTARIASGEEVSKYAGQLGFELSRTLGSREAAQVVQQAIKLNPNLEMSPQGFQTILSSIKQGVKRDIDKRDFLESWMQNPQNGGSPVGFDKAFNAANPVEMYVSRAAPYPAPKSANDLIPKVVYRNKDGKEAIWTGKAFQPVE